MFENCFYGLPCGVNYPEGIKNGLLERLKDAPPEMLARTQIFVNTSRMKKDILAAFNDGVPRFLPQVKLISELGKGSHAKALPDVASSLKIRLELSQIIRLFLEKEPRFSIKSSVYDLADSLAALMSEMQEEGVFIEDFENLNIQDASGHWEKALQFVRIACDYINPDAKDLISIEARQNIIIDLLEQKWTATPPTAPILLVGSTASRKPTARFAHLLTNQKYGAVILPGVDFDNPENIINRIAKNNLNEHPQSRFVDLLKHKEDNAHIKRWHDMAPPSERRNALISLSLRPAPVTNQWMIEGPKFKGISKATQDITLIEAPDPRLESISVALALREAIETNTKAALITPDRDLARRVSALLKKWQIAPDDSAGIPLGQTPPGRLFRHIVSAFGADLSASDILIMLKHPLCSRGKNDAFEQRGYHLLWTRELEVYLRKKNLPVLEATHLTSWAKHSYKDEDDLLRRQDWAQWVSKILTLFDAPLKADFKTYLDQAINIAQEFVRGPHSSVMDELWAQAAGREALRQITEMKRVSESAGLLSAGEFADIFLSIFARAITRDPSPKHPNILIWGTLEARSLNADLVILGGLNEGVWPQAAGQDPWLSRGMRQQAGLPTPEKLIGLSAHDFQQAVAAPKVILSRAKRNAEAETIPSRWLLRLTNLLSGMSEDAKSCLEDMAHRGQYWIDLAHLVDRPETEVAPAQRPSPRPPLEARPRQLSVTKIETLIRDPYEIYANRILKISKLDPIITSPSPADRGTALHKIMELFLSTPLDGRVDLNLDLFLTIAKTVLDEDVIWQSAKRVWMARIQRIASNLIEDELSRAQNACVKALEAKGAMHFPEIDFSLTCKADRIDAADDGSYILYDYKSGDPPSGKQAKYFNIQLYLEAILMFHGKFDGLGKGHVSQAAYLSLKETLATTILDIDFDTIKDFETKFINLIAHYDDPDVGYTAKRALKSTTYTGDYEHLSRFGEWGLSDEPFSEDLS